METVSKKNRQIGDVDYYPCDKCESTKHKVSAIGTRSYTLQCTSCGNEIPVLNGQVLQSTCRGVEMAEPNIVKDPGIAAVLSFLFTGLGQIYNGQIGKGILFIIIQCINIALMLAIVGFITFPLMWLYGIYDAHSVAKATHAVAQGPTVVVQNIPAVQPETVEPIKPEQ